MFFHYVLNSSRCTLNTKQLIRLGATAVRFTDRNVVAESAIISAEQKHDAFIVFILLNKLKLSFQYMGIVMLREKCER